MTGSGMRYPVIAAADGQWLAKPRPRFPLTRVSEIRADLQGRYLIKGLLANSALTVVWGAPKCGKSFWIFDVVMHVASGAIYRGLKVRQGAVVYIAAEGAHGFKARAEAWRARYLAEEDDPPLYLLTIRI